MATNSSNCKLWCITILAAIIVFLFGGGGQTFSQKKSLFLLLPLVPFLLLDAYYLGLERFFVKQYRQNFTGEICPDVPIAGNTKRQQFCETLKAVISFSVWGFYVLVGIILFTVLHLIR
jgi:hypothetical protein